MDDEYEIDSSWKEMYPDWIDDGADILQINQLSPILFR